MNGPLKPVYTKYQSQCCDNSAMTLAVLFSLKTILSLQNGIATNFQTAPLFSMRTVLLASSNSCYSLELTLGVNRPLKFVYTEQKWKAKSMSLSNDICYSHRAETKIKMSKKSFAFRSLSLNEPLLDRNTLWVRTRRRSGPRAAVEPSGLNTCPGYCTSSADSWKDNTERHQQNIHCTAFLLMTH